MDLDVSTWISHCYLPDRTELQEHTLKTDRDLVIGDRCRIDYGLQGDDIVICEFCTINGTILAGGDVRIDNWCEVFGDVIVEEDAYIGEGVKIHGKLVVRGDLDIGDNVSIEKGFEAKGWIVIRNPIPVIMYLLLYLITVLNLDRDDKVDAVLQELFGDEEAEKEPPLRIPPGSVLNMQIFSVPQGMAIGSNCRLHGNIRGESIQIERDTTIFGSLRAIKSVAVGAGTTVHGDVSAEGSIQIEKDAHILGSASAGSLTLHEDARIDGIIKAPNGLKIQRTP
ncbi:MAG: polymer-forming cytoskeletal protein [Methanomicrobiales archaeon]|nr:polymer-forming cytoskeletal protein [Methanomicrobiales archaeon]MDI6876102.1 polymer-forming cytoskeletal protein [Methanomicrobiales archaeon]